MHGADQSPVQEAPLFPNPSTSPWSSPKAFPPSPWDYHHGNTGPSHSTIVKRCGKVLSLGVSDTGLVYAGTESKCIRAWKTPGFTEFSHLKSGCGDVEALLVCSKCALVFSAHSDRKIRVWGSTPVHTRKGTLPSTKESLMDTLVHHPKSLFASKGGSGASSSSSSSSRVKSNAKLKHADSITSLAYNSAANLLYSASLDNSIKVWDVGEMKCIETISAHNDAVNAVAVSPEGFLFSASDDATVKIWKRILGGCFYHALLFYLRQQRSPVKAIAISSAGGDEYVLYAGCADGFMHFWRKGRSPSHMGYMGFLRGHSSAIICLGAAAEVVVSGSADSSLKVWRRNDSSEGAALHQCTAVLSGHMGPVKGVAVKLEGENQCLVYSGSLDGSVKEWRVWRGSSGRGREEKGGGDEDDGGVDWSDYFELSSPMGRLRV